MIEAQDAHRAAVTLQVERPRRLPFGEVPTYSQTWTLLSLGDRQRLAELDRAETEVLTFLAARPEDERDAPPLSDLQVERLSVYRGALERAQRRREQR
ncbi:hypothetical protein [Oerskovia sp. Root22]|uniref:hypothetical protein n=1 Tax=Oerskovia sp. Root22 TaxID=1736494 RepID=UPI000701C380|nr:hypothetical protein [Oerskovia sp. Root22]KRC42967.1 hypothetical protein ASE15_03120 [Oerskovia sp. Root22]